LAVRDVCGKANKWLARQHEGNQSFLDPLFGIKFARRVLSAGKTQAFACYPLQTNLRLDLFPEIGYILPLVQNSTEGFLLFFGLYEPVHETGARPPSLLKCLAVDPFKLTAIKDAIFDAQQEESGEEISLKPYQSAS